MYQYTCDIVSWLYIHIRLQCFVFGMCLVCQSVWFVMYMFWFDLFATLCTNCNISWPFINVIDKFLQKCIDSFLLQILKNLLAPVQICTQGFRVGEIEGLC